jgi:uncharacterized membrane protein YdjX (TVP38/TMEM64 family)
LPSFAAALVAFVGGWMLEEVLQPVLGTAATLVASLIGSTLAFFYVRKWLRGLRGD